MLLFNVQLISNNIKIGAKINYYLLAPIALKYNILIFLFDDAFQQHLQPY